MLELLVTNALLTVLGFFLLWLVFLATKDPTPIDAVWGLGMVTLAVSSFLQAGAEGSRQWLLITLTAIWGLRLGFYMLWRWRDHGPDRRYQAMVGKAQKYRGWGYGKTVGLMVIAIQAPMLFVVCLPAQIGQLGDAEPPGTLALVGAVVAVVGIMFESIADWQLVRFKGDPDNDGQILDRGLWRYTRHPNYFGDALTWWGLFLICLEAPYGWLALPGPVLLTWTLLRWSGAPTLEGKLQRTRPGYVDYISRTSAFIPWPPRRQA